MENLTTWFKICFKFKFKFSYFTSLRWHGVPHRNIGKIPARPIIFGTGLPTSFSYIQSFSFVILCFKIISSNKYSSSLSYSIIPPSDPFLASLSLHHVLFYLHILVSAFQIVSSLVEISPVPVSAINLFYAKNDLHT